MATMGRDLNAHKIWGRSYTFVWFRLWNGLARERGLFVALDRGRCALVVDVLFVDPHRHDAPATSHLKRERRSAKFIIF